MSRHKYCENCAYFAMEDESKEPWGECRKYPPKAGIVAKWPECKQDDWCGQWVSKSVA